MRRGRMASTRSAILYQNLSETVTLIDIPTSIALTAKYEPNLDVLLSSEPPQEPYPSTEPKSERAKANVAKTIGSATESFPTDLLQQALAEIRENHHNGWCFERKISPFQSRVHGKKRKHCSIKQRPPMLVAEEEPDLAVMRRWTRVCAALAVGSVFHLSGNLSSLSDMPDIESQNACIVSNPSPQISKISVPSTEHGYFVPPNASFCMSKITEESASTFSSAVLTLHPNPSPTAGVGQFDLVLLDPPWDNRSVRRSRKYHTISLNEDPMNVIEGMLHPHIAVGALLACWITNKTQVRKAVVKAFDTWDVEIVEEWAWLKTTIHGVPVTDIGGHWRKPYEILLVGRRIDKAYKSLERPTTAQLTRRVLIAVPDLHSRKPCLKELLESLLFNRNEYRALEIFARSLTAGWCSWGNEVLKYNWEGCWSRQECKEVRNAAALDLDG